MRFTTFQSDQGDCIMLTSDDGHHLLVDGGMRDSYTKHVAPHLHRMRRKGDTIDVVCVSHIDRDHVFGLLQMLDDMVAWRVHDYQVSEGNSTHPRPRALRPPEIGRFWHNAFHEQVGKNSGPIADMLAAQSRILSAADNDQIRKLAADLEELAFSEGDAIQLSRRISDRQLNIPLNPEFDGGLMFIPEDLAPLQVGSMSVWVVGPYAEDLRALRRRWNDWLRDNRKFLRTLQRRAGRDEDRLGSGEGGLLRSHFRDQANNFLQSPEVRDFLASSPSTELGQRERVTVPNLASLMLFVEDDRKTALLTGDGHWEDILVGLEDAEKLDNDGRIHLNVLKIPHHGSEHNTHLDFCKRVTADNYVFCGNGAHENPDPRVVEAHIDSRIGLASKRSPNRQATNQFKLLFNCHQDNPDLNRAQQSHLRELERLVRRRQSGSGGKLKFEFMTRSLDRFTL